MRKVIVVAEEEIHTLVASSYPDWDTQKSIQSVDDLWESLSNGSLSDQSEFIFLSDSLYDPNHDSEELEMAIATLTPNALVVVVTSHPENVENLRLRVKEIMIRENIEQFSYYTMMIDDIGGDISQVITEQPIGENEESVESKPNRNGMVVSLTSAKGGTGKSTSALLLSSAIARASKVAVEKDESTEKAKIVIVDTSTPSGAISAYTVVVGRGLSSLAKVKLLQKADEAKGLNDDPYITDYNAFVDNYLLRPYTEDISIVTGTRMLMDSVLTHDDYTELINNLRTKFDVIILDTSGGYLDSVVKDVCYPLSDAILYVTDLDISSVMNMAEWVAYNKNSGMSLSKVGLVINKSHKNAHMSLDKVQQASQGLPVLVAAPFKPDLFATSLNKDKGIEHILDDDEIGATYFRLARKVVGSRFPLADFS